MTNSLLFEIGFYCYLLATFMIMVLGFIYSFRSQLMPYHLKALNSSWSEIDKNYQLLFKALLNGAGFYSLSSAMFMLIILLVPFRSGELWAGLSIGVFGLVGALPLWLIVRRVKNNTEGNPPLGLVVFVNFLLLSGLICSIAS